MTDEQRSEETAVNGSNVADAESGGAADAGVREAVTDGSGTAGTAAGTAAGAESDTGAAAGPTSGSAEGGGAGTGGTAFEEAAAEQIEAMRSELESLNDRYLRLAAEFDNYRKRTERERAEQSVRARAEVVTGLLEVLDDLQRVVELGEEKATIASLYEGFVLVEKKFRRALEAVGLEPIQAEGEFFNPTSMEALMTVPTDVPEEDDMVADVFQKGYRFGEILIRPARVRAKKHEG